MHFTAALRERPWCNLGRTGCAAGALQRNASCSRGNGRGQARAWSILAYTASAYAFQALVVFLLGPALARSKIAIVVHTQIGVRRCVQGLDEQASRSCGTRATQYTVVRMCTQMRDFEIDFHPLAPSVWPRLGFLQACDGARARVISISRFSRTLPFSH
jgi:hypothetical protein